MYEYKNVPPAECSTQLKVMAPSLILSLKRSRKVPLTLSSSSTCVVFRLTNPMMYLSTRRERWGRLSIVSSSGLAFPTQDKQRLWFGWRRYPLCQRSNRCFLIKSRMASIQIHTLSLWCRGNMEGIIRTKQRTEENVQTTARPPHPSSTSVLHLPWNYSSERDRQIHLRRNRVPVKRQFLFLG